ncbi:hypothetical protein GOBAR_AA28251 [Gossypium barbadense]|uniref:Heat shock 70 kDa protein 8 n=1 Tax=Gossypium barbadense TaxID=3634 RepID=A0A2P5WMV7_GOSBA|nr:hypothetical protein GOBAR_AA28251 [Gossypium barbadense]
MAEVAYTVEPDCETTEEKSLSAFPEIAIGIDIGTSEFSVAVWNGSQVELLKNTRNKPLICSDVPLNDDIPSVGVSYYLSHEHERFSGASILNMKRLIGRVNTDRLVQAGKNFPFLVQTLDMGGRPFIAALVNNVWKSTAPEEVLALYLVELRIMAESKLKRPIKNVVLCIPVSFSRFQLIPKPAAVALLYAQQQQQHMIHDNMDRGSKKVALIFNMGAGYCDVAVTATAGGVSQIKALAGSATGGEDFLRNMMCHLLPNFDSLFSSHEINEISSMWLLRVATQYVIHKLSFEESVQIDVDLGNGLRICKQVSREEFEEVNQKIFEKCGSLIIQYNLTNVIVVGGCSYIPKIKNLVKSVCKRELYKGMNPLEAAVCRTALNSFVSIIPRNTTIPVHKELIVTTGNDNQKEVLIVIYEGDAEKTEGNHLLGYFKIAGIPPAPKGVPQIKVSMDINASNVLSVFAGLIMTGSQQPVVPIMEVRMPTVDNCYCCCTEVLHREYLSTLNFI